jgi:hypothetical protein
VIVDNVEGITVHLKNGNSIRFTEEEISLQVVKTTIPNDDDPDRGTPVSYYIITTTALEE